MKTALADRYIHSDDFASRIDGVELAPEIWAVFAQLAQARNASEIAANLKLDIEAVQAALRRLGRRKLIQKHVLGWRAYAAAAAIPIPAAPAPSPAPSTPASPVLSVTVTPTPEPPAPVLVTPPPLAPLLRFRIASDRPPAPAPAIRFRIASPGAVAPAAPASSSKWRLRPVLDAIGAKAGGGVAGQLLVYRVFLNVPSDLMQAGGLHSLNFMDDHFVAAHAPLRAAIIKAARAHAAVDVEPLLAG